MIQWKNLRDELPEFNKQILVFNKSDNKYIIGYVNIYKGCWPEDSTERIMLYNDSYVGILDIGVLKALKDIGKTYLWMEIPKYETIHN